MPGQRALALGEMAVWGEEPGAADLWRRLAADQRESAASARQAAAITGSAGIV